MQPFLQLQNTILEMIARGEALERAATRLCIEAEKLVPGVICSILTVDPAGLLHPLAGPSLPDGYSAALEGVAIGPKVGSCGTAAYLRTPITVVDIEADELWAEFKHLALPIGLRACWSSPILDSEGAPIGTFAFYFRECRGPTEAEQRIVQVFIPLAVIAIERHQRVAERERQAYTDALTGLPNRASFETVLAALPCEVPETWALLAVDLDNLKVVNDTFGHHTGDCLLRVASARIWQASFPHRSFRIGGDEFAVIVQSADALQDLGELAERILSALMRPTDCGGHVVVPRATIGGALFSKEDRTADRVRQNADFALYHAKESGRGGFVQYWPGIGTSITRRLEAIQSVDTALRENRIEAHYQPIVLLGTREVVGLEALCRLRLGERIITAASFHEATTDVHVATALTARMMSLVASDVRAWLDLGIPFGHVGINVSSADMHGAVDQVLETAFGAEGVPLSHVILEVTESVYMGRDNRIVQSAVEALRAKGLRVALDDFGTGFASLTHLLSVPVDIIKIDKSFVDRLAPGDASEAIIEGLIRIAGKLDIRVIAEGVETEAQARHLESLGCMLGQGYLFSRAVDRQGATALLTGTADR
jgi:diguanylate cyclase (GGDEF)-like protein